MTKISVLLAAAPPSDGPCALRNRRRLRAGRGFRHRTPWRRGLSITGASSGKRRPGSCGALRSVRLARSSTPEPAVSCKTITFDPPLGRAAQGLGIPSRTVTVEAALSKRSAAAGITTAWWFTHPLTRRDASSRVARSFPAGGHAPEQGAPSLRPVYRSRSSAVPAKSCRCCP